MKKPLLIVLVLAIGSGVIWYVYQYRDSEGHSGPFAEAPSLSMEEARRLLELKNLALGQLENHAVTDAIAVYGELQEALPDEPLVTRNLAIARVFAVEKDEDNPLNTTDAGARDAAVSAARDAVDDLMAREPNSPLAHFLVGKLAGFDQDYAAATRAFIAAAESALSDPATSRFAPALFYAAKDASVSAFQDPETQQLGEDALRRAFELLPENLFFWSNWIVEQAKNEDPGLRDTLLAMRPQIEAIAPDVLTVAGANMLESLDAAVAAIDAGDWRTASAQAYGIHHPIKVHDAFRSDRDYRMKIHVLDFVDTDFSAEFYEARPDLSVPVERTQVRFAASAQQLPIDPGTVTDVQLADIDLDFQPEVCLLYPDRVEVWSHSTAAQPEEWALRSSVTLTETYRGMLLCDLDDDWEESPRRKAGGSSQAAQNQENMKTDNHDNCAAADPDLVLFGEAGVLLLQNVWDRETDARSWSAPTPPAGLADPPELPQLAGVQFATAADVDVDGDLDLIFIADGSLRLWSNRNNFLFRDVTQHAALPEDLAPITAAVGADWDRDVDIDIVLSCDDGTVGVLENLRHGTLRWRELESLDFEAAESLAVVELDGNVSWDLLVGSDSGVEAVRTRTPFKGRVDVIEHAPAGPVPAQRLFAWDVDNDGHEDLLSWDSNGVYSLRGLAEGGFAEAPELFESISLESPIVACRTADLDVDGDLDLVVADQTGVKLLTNEGGNENGWLLLTLAAVVDTEDVNYQTRRVNHYGIGSTVELRAGPQYQAKVAAGQVMHFGLGPLASADVVRVIWTNGFPENTMQPEARQQICEVETPKGSCPFLYTWDGERFRFVTDLCWAAPLGLQSAQGGVIPCQDEEHILVPGEFLRPRDGKYVLQITSELWEADYFDELELIVVDHPADVDVFSNEKVAPPDLNRFAVHTAREKRTPRAARNRVGRDLLPELRERDEIYAQPFERHLMQGYTDDSVMEIDLGDVPDPDNVKLFLTGWIFPTDTTINVALAENPLLPGPQPPMLSVPDADGNWQTVYPSMGFPGGKTKTIVVDLSGRFLTEDYRARITTSMQLSWDEVFFTSGEAPAELSLTHLSPLSADLHCRGFSRRVPRPHNAPADFDYDAVRTEPAWPTMEGPFTNYGDVLRQVSQADDVVAAMSPGDELTIEFPAPADPPDGWTRDFILRTVGWDKDADLHTYCGQTAGPYPTRGADHYPSTFDFGPSGDDGRETDDLQFRRLLKLWRPGMELENP